MADGLWGDKSPIVIPYGQTSSGKTTALVRLIKYLQKHEHSYELCKYFHGHYYPEVDHETIKGFFTKQMQGPINDVKGNADAFFCNIKKSGNGTICRFLESPGENLFALQKAADQDIYRDNNIVIEDEFQYLLDIIETKAYKKIWIFFMDPGFTAELKKEKPFYISRIKQIARTLGPNDNVIFLVNKADLVMGKYGPIIKDKGYEGYINEQYENILKMEPFTTETIRWWWPFSKKIVTHYRIVPFCSYDVVSRGRDANSGNRQSTIYEEGNSKYPKDLWKVINEAIMNKW